MNRRVDTPTEQQSVTDREDFVAALGKYPDAEVGRMFGVSVAVVQYARKTRSVPSHAEVRRQEVVPLLKTHSDAYLMEHYGYSRAGLARLRRLHKVTYDGSAEEKAVAIPVEVVATAAVNPLVDVKLLTADPSIMEFLSRRHKAGDSAEALAARIEVPAELVRVALGIAQN